MKQRKSAQPMTISKISRPMTPANAATVMVVGSEPFCVVSDSEVVMDTFSLVDVGKFSAVVAVVLVTFAEFGSGSVMVVAVVVAINLMP